MKLDPQVLSWLYVVSSSVIVLAHIPQIVAVLRAKSDCSEVSLWSWGIWTLCMSISTFYFKLVVADFKATVFAAIVCICCGLVFSITCWKRIHYARSRSELSPLSSRVPG